MMTSKRLLSLLTTCLLGLGLVTAISATSTAEAATGPVFTVMNTSESLPDGVYFRNSPSWNDTSRTYGLGVFMNERVQLQCYAFGEAIGSYANRLWYYTLNVSRTVNYDGQANQGMLNAHYVNDGHLSNVVVAGVPACVNNRPPAPAATPVVTLAQGPAAQVGYRYAITLSGFPANTAVTISCRDSADPGGFYTFTLTVNGSGGASTQSYCYSDDGPDHWVVANGVESNHVSWNSPPPVVPDPPPAPIPTVRLAQGPAASPGYWYAISLSGFSAGAAVAVSCRDSADPGGFRSFTLAINGGGQAFTQASCRSGDGPDHWVTANAVESNHVSWSRSGSGNAGNDGTGSTGPTKESSSGPERLDPRPTGSLPFPALPKDTGLLPKQPPASAMAQLSASIPHAEMKNVLRFCLDVGFTHCYAAGRHFLDASGTAMTVSMDELLTITPLRKLYEYWLRDNVAKSLVALKQSAPNSAVTRHWDTAGTTNNWTSFYAADKTSDWFWTLGHFNIRMTGTVWVGAADASGNRPVQVQYRSFMWDVYNFNPGEPFGSFEDLAKKGIAADFLETGSSGVQTISGHLANLNPQALELRW